MAKFEDEMTELDSVVDRMEIGGLGLEETVALYERGGTLLKSLRTQIDDAERRIRVVDEMTTDTSQPLHEIEVPTDDDELEETYDEE